MSLLFSKRQPPLSAANLATNFSDDPQPIAFGPQEYALRAVLNLETAARRPPPPPAEPTDEGTLRCMITEVEQHRDGVQKALQTTRALVEHHAHPAVALDSRSAQHGTRMEAAALGSYARRAMDQPADPDASLSSVQRAQLGMLTVQARHEIRKQLARLKEAGAGTMPQETDPKKKRLAQEASTSLRRWAYETQQALEGPMALTDWGLGRFEGAFKSCERQLQRQRLPLALGAVKALEALETAWAQYCQACRTFEALYVDVNLSNVLVDLSTQGAARHAAQRPGPRRRPAQRKSDWDDRFHITEPWNVPRRHVEKWENKLDESTTPTPPSKEYRRVKEEALKARPQAKSKANRPKPRPKPLKPVLKAPSGQRPKSSRRLQPAFENARTQAAHTHSPPPTPNEEAPTVNRQQTHTASAPRAVAARSIDALVDPTPIPRPKSHPRQSSSGSAAYDPQTPPLTPRQRRNRETISHAYEILRRRQETADTGGTDAEGDPVTNERPPTPTAAPSSKDSAASRIPEHLYTHPAETDTASLDSVPRPAPRRERMPPSQLSAVERSSSEGEPTSRTIPRARLASAPPQTQPPHPAQGNATLGAAAQLVLQQIAASLDHMAAEENAIRSFWSTATVQDTFAPRPSSPSLAQATWAPDAILALASTPLPSEADVSAAARARALALGPELAQPYRHRNGLGGLRWTTPSAAAATPDTLLSDDPAPVSFRNGSSRATQEVEKTPENTPRRGADRRGTDDVGGEARAHLLGRAVRLPSDLLERTEAYQDAYDEYSKRCFASHGVRGTPWEQVENICHELFESAVNDVMREVHDVLSDELEATLEAELAVPNELADRIVPAASLSAAGAPVSPPRGKHQLGGGDARDSGPEIRGSSLQPESVMSPGRVETIHRSAGDDDDAQSDSTVSSFRPPSVGTPTPRGSPGRQPSAESSAHYATRSYFEGGAVAGVDGGDVSSAEYTEDFEETEEADGEVRSEVRSEVEPVAYESDFEAVTDDASSSHADSVASSVATLSS